MLASVSLCLIYLKLAENSFKALIHNNLLMIERGQIKDKLVSVI